MQAFMSWHEKGKFFNLRDLQIQIFLTCVYWHGLQAEMAESSHSHDSSGIVSLIVKDTRTK